MVEDGTAQKGGAVSSTALNEASATSAMREAAQKAQKAGILPESVSMGVDIVEVARMRAIMRRRPHSLNARFRAKNEPIVMQQLHLSFIMLRALPQKRLWLRPWARVSGTVSGLTILKCT